MTKYAPSPVARYFLRTLLNVIPVYTSLEPYRDLNMNVWRANGSYSLVSSDSSKFVLKVNQREYAANLLAEIQHLLNHSMEHRAHIVNSLSTGEDPSPAWSFVSLYYFSLFVAMAWTRIANKGIFYLDKNSISQYCGSATRTPGAGAFCATASEDEDASAFYVTFKKCGRSHFHEAVWVGAANEAKDVADWIEQLSSERRASDEEISSLKAMRIFLGSKFNDPQTWPSVLRNSLNYRPGFGYRSVIKNNQIKIRSRLIKSSLPNMSEIISFGERAKQSLRDCKEPFESVNDSIDLLIVQTLLLENFVEESIFHLLSIQNLDCSASAQRSRYGRNYAKKIDTILKPIRQ